MYEWERLVCQIWAGGGSLCEGRGNCLKYLKSGWNRKERSGNKNFKKLGGGGGGQTGLRGGCLKKVGLELPCKLWIYQHIHAISSICSSFFFNKMLLSTQSNAFLRPVTMLYANLSWSIIFLILSIRFIMACVVEEFFAKPNYLRQKVLCCLACVCYFVKTYDTSDLII